MTKNNDPKPVWLRIVVCVIAGSTSQVDGLLCVPLQSLGEMLRFEIGPEFVHDKNIGIDGLHRQKTA